MALVAGAVLACTGLSLPVGAASSTPQCGPLVTALDGLVHMDAGPPGVIVVVQRGTRLSVYRDGTGDVGGNDPIEPTDAMRVASVAKAYSSAVAQALVAKGTLSLTDTVG